MKKIFQFCVNHPYVILLILLAITTVAAVQIPTIKVDSRAEIFIAEDNPVRMAYVKNLDDFTSREETFIGIVAPTIYDRGILEKIFLISQAVEQVQHVDKIRNILTMDYIKGSESGLKVAPMSPDGLVPKDDIQIHELKDKADSWDFYKGLFVSGDDTGTLISFTMKEGTQTNDMIPVYYNVKRIVDKLKGGSEVFISGVPVVNALMSDYMLRDMRIFIPIVNLVIITTLFILFRNVRGVVLPLVTVALAATWSMGLMAYLKWPLTLVTSTLPVMLTAVGTAYGIHVLENVFSDAATGVRGKPGIVSATSRVSLPVIMAGLTTMGGFASLMTTDVVPIKQLGVLATFGVFAALGISLTFIPAVLSIMDAWGMEYIPDHRSRRDIVAPALRFFTFLALKKSTATILVFTAILFVSIVGGSLIISDMDPIQNFKKSSPIRVADDYLNAKFAGTSMFNVVITGAHPDDIKDPAVLARIEELQTRLAGIQGVGKAVSIVDLLKRMNQVMHADDTRYARIPESRELVAQYLLLYSFSGSDEIERFVNPDFQKAQILLVIKSQAGDLAKQVVAEIDKFKHELNGTGLDVQATGISAITMEFNRIVIVGQISSFILAFIFVILATMPIFKSVKLGLFSIMPLAIPILINFGIMGFTGITLNASTAMIASITVGVGIDYSIHFLARYRHELASAASIEQAITQAISTSGRAIIYNALAVAMGFLVLVLSSFVPIIQTGFLTALVMFTSSTAALTALPAVIYKFHPRLRADAGDNHPNQSIQQGGRNEL